MDEKALIERAAKGDGQAFSELMAAQEGRMYAVALRMCGHREDAQDCLQEAMLRVYRSISSFKGQSSFSTWVYRITMNTCLDELRRGKRRKASSLDERIDAGWALSLIHICSTPSEPGRWRFEVRVGCMLWVEK